MIIYVSDVSGEVHLLSMTLYGMASCRVSALAWHSSTTGLKLVVPTTTTLQQAL